MPRGIQPFISKPMLIGLTGGIATGKSTFRQILAEKHDFVLFDADRCVHRLLSEDQSVIRNIRNQFGAKAIAADGTVNRPALREIVFPDAGKRKLLEHLIHPEVRSCWLNLRQSCAAENNDFLAEIPLLFETGAEKFFDLTILVAASDRIQRERLASRGLEPRIVEAMLASQCPIGEKDKRASVVIWNDGTFAELEHQALLLIERFFPFRHE